MPSGNSRTGVTLAVCRTRVAASKGLKVSQKCDTLVLRYRKISKKNKRLLVTASTSCFLLHVRRSPERSARGSSVLRGGQRKLMDDTSNVFSGRYV